jgi:hypothetical protein
MDWLKRKRDFISIFAASPAAVAISTKHPQPHPGQVWRGLPHFCWNGGWRYVVGDVTFIPDRILRAAMQKLTANSIYMHLIVGC